MGYDLCLKCSVFCVIHSNYLFIYFYTFQNNNHVINLELEDNALTTTGIRYLMEMFQTNISIQKLVLNLKWSHWIHQFWKIWTTDCYNIINSVAITSVFFHLENDLMSFFFQNLSNNQLRLEGADIISKMLLDNYYIQSLKLSGD